MLDAGVGGKGAAAPSLLAKGEMMPPFGLRRRLQEVSRESLCSKAARKGQASEVDSEAYVDI